MIEHYLRRSHGKSETMHYEILENNLKIVLSEITRQPHVGLLFPPGLRPYSEQMEQIRELIEDAGEYSVAFECIVAMIEGFPFKLSGYAAVKLLEVGLILKYKTDRPKDTLFDSRQNADEKWILKNSMKGMKRKFRHLSDRNELASPDLRSLRDRGAGTGQQIGNIPIG